MTIIRSATTTDAQQVAECHYQAVHKGTDNLYDRIILDEWSPVVTPKRVQEFVAAIESRDEWMIVVEENGNLLGFGSLTAARNELTSVYVWPAAGSRGIGRSIVDCLSNHAYSQGLDYLQLDASLNSIGFYERCGFAVKATATHKLDSRIRMECCVMRKSLRVCNGQN